MTEPGRGVEAIVTQGIDWLAIPLAVGVEIDVKVRTRVKVSVETGTNMVTM